MRVLVHCSACLAFAFGSPGLASAADWLQFGYDTTHSGFNAAEPGYPTASGNTVLYHYALPTRAGRVDAAPVYISDVATPTGNRNVLILVSTNGTVLALDADSPVLDVLWSKQPAGTGMATNGSAAIDPDRVHVYATGLDGKIHKYTIADGSEVIAGGWPAISTLKPDQEKASASLAFATAATGTSYVYAVTSGYVDDANDYQGHVTAIATDSGAQKVFNAQCSDLTIHYVKNGITAGNGQDDCPRIGGGNSGMWGRPGVTYDARTDRIFVTTGNGLFDPNNSTGNGRDWGDTLLALNPDGSGSGGGMPVDSYTPVTYGSDIPQAGLEGYDADLGAVSLAIVPAPPGTALPYRSLGVQGGKDGCIRLINLADLNGTATPAHVGGELQALDFPGGSNCATGMDGPEIKSQPAVWKNPADGSIWIYITTPYNGMAAYQIVANEAGFPSLSLRWTSVGGTSPVVANGVIYFMTDTRIHALDAVTGASVISDASTWATTAFNDSHWQSPILVNGRIYVVDGDKPSTQSQLWVYALDGVFKSGFE
jgi:hypothetical protein